ncbi:class I SAM-dependent methyltransferase [Endozoicomonas lisbonensis]|uniref:SAM-dependent methyltransferase n=1 Tax=Endozoicomonas lisbonensis TaxID=3120522 RepID=A0ABV2SPV5_9GAMM
MPQTIAFYEQNSDSFFDSTVTVDAQALYDQFLPLLPEQAHILDAGCGSGRDSLAFLKAGYRVSAFDGSESMGQRASGLTGLDVKHSLFLDFSSDEQFDAIWACASLLHVPLQELSVTFSHLSTFLKGDGLFYCSFKLGNGEEKRGGRHFTNLDEQGFEKVLKSTDLTIARTWITQDLRPGRENEHWLNAILKKA